MASIVELFSLWTIVSPSLSTDMATELTLRPRPRPRSPRPRPRPRLASYTVVYSSVGADAIRICNKNTRQRRKIQQAESTQPDESKSHITTPHGDVTSQEQNAESPSRELQTTAQRMTQ